MIAATLLCEVGDPFRFAREARFARWSGTGVVAVSSGEGDGQPVRHRLDTGGNRRVNSVLYIISVTQQRQHSDAQRFLARKTAEGKTRREARRAHKRHLATVTSDACGATNTPAVHRSRRPLDKGAVRNG